MQPRMYPLCCCLIFLLFACVCPAQVEVPEATEGIRLRGANGAEIVVAGVLEARPEGAVLLMYGQQSTILAHWNKFDLELLKEDQPEMYYGYLDATRYNRPFLLKLGVFEGIVSFEEAVTQIHRELSKPRYYPLPENVNYLIEQEPDVIRWKARDLTRYSKLMRDHQQQLQDFLRRIFPKESVIIDDQGNVHFKDRPTRVDLNRGETSLSTILTVLADTRRAPSRIGLDYLKEVTTFREDISSQWKELRKGIPNASFDEGNLNHQKLPILMDESRLALIALLNESHLHQSHQQKISDFYLFIYSHTPSY
ncbi:hypothetical protein [Cerasicoccus fimbriatus]|uniref:hypothetical protein n=1 Tax=Cerasicoccus fimbriatus TaxID=3014554 RepID=UPI0022B469AE|nr:hypothetical protein [Cerasicoccus sp. TK19100]